MSLLRRNLATLLLILTFAGWFQYYPGMLGDGQWEWYSNVPEHYAWPASLSKPSDPRWGFWFW
jgi:hypothetical protein